VGWGGHGNGGEVKPKDMFGVESLLDVYLCVYSASLIEARKTVPMPIRG